MEKIIILLAGMSIFCCFSSCCKQDRCYVHYDFEIPFSISPANDTFKIGDTIWLESVIESKLLDKNTNTLIEVNNFDFKIQTGIFRVDTSKSYSAELEFDYVKEKGNYIITPFSAGNWAEVKYAYSNKQELKIGIIPTQRTIKGVYVVSFYTLLSSNITPKINELNCVENLKLSMSMNLNLNDNNYELMQTSFFSPFATISFIDYQRFGDYAFVVQ